MAPGNETTVPDLPTPSEIADPESAGIGDSRPFFFLHIPKTAGTSFLATLQNLFGESRTLRLAVETPDLDDRIADVAGGRGDPEITCLNGHLPLDVMAPFIDAFRTFTILRNPIERVFSLYRFQRANPDIAAFDLPPDFSFEAFLNARHPAIYAQANNGMTRMLAGEHAFTNPDDDRFEDPDRHPELIGRALDFLESIDFGLAEDMPGAHRIIQHHWGLPFALDEMTLNTTERDLIHTDWSNIHALVERNRLDITLYERACGLYRSRLAALPDSPPAPTAERMLFKPVLDCETALPDVPGRQGFHPWYEAGLAWIAEGPPARIHFLPPASIVRIRLRVFAMVADYAVERVKLHLHGHPLPFRVTERDGASCVLETRYASTVPGMNTLTITPPAFIRVRDLDPTSPDPRRLGLAVTSITFAGIA